ncbi:MAG: hypothetical protein U1E22_01395 [Coriobacteriia bacterium]|nr:hypothetical protein [Coriobacteriia bacterium]
MAYRDQLVIAAIGTITSLTVTRWWGRAAAQFWLCLDEEQTRVVGRWLAAGGLVVTAACVVISLRAW